MYLYKNIIFILYNILCKIMSLYYIFIEIKIKLPTVSVSARRVSFDPTGVPVQPQVAFTKANAWVGG